MSEEIDPQILASLRSVILSFAATVVVNVIKNEGADSPIIKLAADIGDDNSLAAAIHRLLEQQEWDG